MTKQEATQFRQDFQSTVANLEKQYGVNISLGPIGFDENGLSAKMKAEKGAKIIRATKNDFEVGDIVGIDHKKINKNDEFEILKINAKNIKVQKINVGDGRVGALMNVSPGLLVKK
jgi:hypothetical protein|tara:strand:+ start:2770 stop:3117 length:348 start_codon:yes stop_codon:yes gene_type:complete